MGRCRYRHNMWCNCGKIKGGKSDENSIYVSNFSLATLTIVIKYLTESDTSEDYISIEELNGDAPTVSTHWKYVSEWGNALKEALETAAEEGVLDLFLVGINWFPITWATWTFSDESWAFVENILKNPSDETVDAFIDFLHSCMEESPVKYIITRNNPPQPTEITIVSHWSLTPVDGDSGQAWILLTPGSETLSVSVDSPIMEIESVTEHTPGLWAWNVDYRFDGTWTVTATFSASSDPTVSTSLTFDVQPGR